MGASFHSRFPRQLQPQDLRRGRDGHRQSHSETLAHQPFCGVRCCQGHGEIPGLPLRGGAHQEPEQENRHFDHQSGVDGESREPVCAADQHHLHHREEAVDPRELDQMLLLQVQRALLRQEPEDVPLCLFS